jgi:hypothetical protein
MIRSSVSPVSFPQCLLEMEHPVPGVSSPWLPGTTPFGVHTHFLFCGQSPDAMTASLDTCGRPLEPALHGQTRLPKKNIGLSFLLFPPSLRHPRVSRALYVVVFVSLLCVVICLAVRARCGGDVART